MSLNAARILRLPLGDLAEGKAADVTIIDPEMKWTVDANTFESKSRNTPFNGMQVKGRAVYTIVRGNLVWQLDGVERKSEKKSRMKVNA
jgi:dihydroorotase